MSDFNDINNLNNTDESENSSPIDVTYEEVREEEETASLPAEEPATEEPAAEEKPSYEHSGASSYQYDGTGASSSSYYADSNEYVYAPEQNKKASGKGGRIALALIAIALGIFVSSLTENQLVAAVCSFAATYLIYSLDSLAGIINISWVTSIVNAISFVGRYTTFTEGIIDYSNIVFFVGFAAIFIFLTVRILDKRRYS